MLLVLSGLILTFELTRRIVAICKGNLVDLNSIMYHLLPRPWCAISCWSIIIAVIFRKQYLYNVSCYCSLICSIIFFAYPGVGFNNKYILFENLYSICTHSLLLITSITLITLKFTKFDYKQIWKDLICLAIIFVYAFLEIYLLKIATDPLYFMPGNDIQDIVGLSYGVFLPIYIIFLIVYINIFYFINDFKRVKSIFKGRKK